MALNLEIVIQAVDRATGVISRVEKALSGLQRQGGALRSIGSGISALGAGMTAFVTLPIAGALTAAAKSAIQFETAMSDVYKAFNLRRGTEEALAMDQAILQLARTVPIATTDLAAMTAAAGRLGVAKSSVNEFVRASAEIAVALDLPYDQAGDQLGQLANVMGFFNAKTGELDIGALRSYADAINFLEDSTASRGADIINVSQRIGAMLLSLGFARNEIAGLSAAFLSTGRAPEVVSTALAGTIPLLATATRQTEKFKGGIEQLGYTAEGLEAQFAADPLLAFLDVLDRLNKVPGQQRLGIIQSIFGQGEDARTIALAAEQIDQIRATLGLVNKIPAGNISQQFAQQMQTTENQLGVFRNNLFEVGVTLGAALLPPLNQLLTAVTPLVQKFADFAKANPGIVQMGLAIAGVVAIVGPLLVIIGAVVTAIGAIGSVLGAVIGFIGGAIAIIGGVGAAIIGLVAVAIAAGIAILTYWNQIGAFFSQLWTSITAGASGMGAAIQSAFVGIATTVVAFWANLIATIGNSIAQIAALIASGLTGAVSGIVSTFTSITATIAGSVAQIISWISQLISSFSSAGSAGSAALSSIASGAPPVMAAISAIGSAALSLPGVFASVGSAILGTLNGIAGSAFAAGAAIVSSIASGIMSGIGQVVAAASAVAAAVANVMPKSPPKEGPMRDLYSYGPRITDAIAAGMNPNTVAQAAYRVATAATGSNPLIGTGGGGGGVNVSYGDIHVGAGTDIGAFRQALDEHAAHIASLVQKRGQYQNRVSYG